MIYGMVRDGADWRWKTADERMQENREGLALRDTLESLRALRALRWPWWTGLRGDESVAEREGL